MEPSCTLTKPRPLARRVVRSAFGRVSVRLAVIALLIGAASPVASATTTPTRSELGSAYASFQVQDGCMETYTSVQATDSTTLPPGTPGATSSAFMQVLEYDRCSEAIVLTASGEARLDPADFEFSEGGTAALHTAITAFDTLTNREIPFRVDLTWGATSVGTDQHTLSAFHGPFGASNFHTRSQVWNADVSGSVSDGLTEFARGTFSASMYADDFGAVDIQHRAQIARTAGSITAERGAANWVASGEDAGVTWDTFDATGCVHSWLYLAAMNREPGAPWGVDGPYSAVVVYWRIYDQCSNRSLADGSAFQLLPQGAFIVRSAFASTSLQTTVLGFDYTSGETVTVDVDLAWRAHGQPTFWQLTARDFLYGYTRHYSERWGAAVAIGHVDVNDLTFDTPPSSAVLSQFDDRATVSRP